MSIKQIFPARNSLWARHGVTRIVVHLVAILLLLPASQTFAKSPLPELVSANAKCLAAFEYLEKLQEGNQNSDAKETRDVYHQLALLHRESLVVLAGAARAVREADRARSALAHRIGALELEQTLGLITQETLLCEGLPDELTEAQLDRVTAAVEKKLTSK